MWNFLLPGPASSSAWSIGGDNFDQIKGPDTLRRGTFKWGTNAATPPFPSSSISLAGAEEEHENDDDDGESISFMTTVFSSSVSTVSNLQLNDAATHHLESVKDR